jgi:hypothetical protein
MSFWTLEVVVGSTQQIPTDRRARCGFKWESGPISIPQTWCLAERDMRLPSLLKMLILYR